VIAPWHAAAASAWIAAVTLVAAVDRMRGGSRWRGRRYDFAR
jgi:hypothetical protein